MNSGLTSKYIARLDSIIKVHEEFNWNPDEMVLDRISYRLLTQSRVAVESISGKASHYTRQIEEILREEWHVSYKTDMVIGIVEALRDDIHHGFLVSFSELVRGEVFQDFLDMAEYLYQEGYKDAAAVIAGSTLEAHLRQLSHKHVIDISSTASDGNIRPKKASQLNQELGKVAYSLFDQKQITAWLDLRNNAAHGRYDEYSLQQVEQFIGWLKDFMARNPS